MAINVKGLAAIGAGSLFLWSGIKGWSVLGLLGDIVTGNKPVQPAVNSFTQVQNYNPSGGIDGSNAGGIAGVAAQYEGHSYLYGGAPGLDGSKPWDCSSFVNWVCGVKLGLPIPGYAANSYKGEVHGPPTGSWGVWPGLQHVDRSNVQAGDIVVWLNHMGIALGNNEMISALNHSEGTKKTAIDGYGNGPILCYGRYNITGPGPTFGGGNG